MSFCFVKLVLTQRIEGLINDLNVPRDDQFKLASGIHPFFIWYGHPFYSDFENINSTLEIKRVNLGKHETLANHQFEYSVQRLDSINQSK